MALKIGTADSRLGETTVLRRLSDDEAGSLPGLVASGRDAIPEVLDGFTVRGPNGTHPCYATAVAQCDLGDASFYYMFKLDVARALCLKLVSAIAFIHSQGYVHGGLSSCGPYLGCIVSNTLLLVDIHLGNFMLKLPPDLNSLSIEKLQEKYGLPETVAICRVDGGTLPPNIPPKAVLPLYLGKNAKDVSLQGTRLILSDFGEAFEPASRTRLCQDSRSPLAARPPEARFEPLSPLSFSADIWSLAVAMWNIVGMKPMFSDEFVTPDSVVAQQVDVLGPLPSSWWQLWAQRNEFFDERGNSIQGEDASPPLIEAFDAWVQNYRKKHHVGIFSEEEKAAFLQLLRPMLSIDPQKRPTGEEVLGSDWVVKWARQKSDTNITASLKPIIYGQLRILKIYIQSLSCIYTFGLPSIWFGSICIPFFPRQTTNFPS